ncbi:hypothetical protein [Nostoc sp.]|uniref:hypothetical protein n=1 Tax=Nostoc sp. TaxID=1180 RepID=UPI002FF55AEC
MATNEASAKSIGISRYCSISERFNLTSNQTWEQILLFFSQDEHTALEQFFKLFDEFIQTEDPSEFQPNTTINNSKLFAQCLVEKRVSGEDALDILGSRVVEQEVLDLIEEPETW